MDQKLGYLTIFSIFFIPRLFMMASSKRCEPKLLESGGALKNHILKTVAVRTPLDCFFLCQNNMKCKSYNFMISFDICELNNSTKEARPHDFLPDGARFYMGIRRDTAVPVSSSSCKELYEKHKFSKSQVYPLMFGSQKIPVYCHMGNFGCGGGGWTLAIKIDGKKKTFHYDSALWSNKNAYNLPGGKTGFDFEETKLPTYWNTSFSKICLGMKISGRQLIRFLVINKQAQSLHSLIADGKYSYTSLSRDKWKTLIGSQASLQDNCNRNGFNAASKGHSRTRIGIIGNNENDCVTPDSRIGFGNGGFHDDSNTCGNFAVDGAYSDNGGKNITAMGYILVQ
ncbi:uncharacterized skeletal organic matrix protein 5-like [Montipora capricornis]|uniref:uncharacterized skeletal organic matrix protein 5-like n=1 Tax=Montipora capricornis TaxID=246305 RepID=UPI0035F1DFB1